MSHQSKTFQTVNEAYQFLEELGALPKLILHVKLVGEAADLLISKLHELQVQFDESFLRLGVVFHDAGKIIHPEELTAKGNNHEAEVRSYSSIMELILIWRVVVVLMLNGKQ
ncbi:hypothetical protein [Nostoc piscinale]|uniref:hypothetical protein n=1 Tax=Nostoc piscinale TaxID=224012 RepID=UPI000AB6E668|nr:hypothetical protein [Nostoc piscinale]